MKTGSMWTCCNLCWALPEHGCHLLDCSGPANQVQDVAKLQSRLVVGHQFYTGTVEP
jgi:hypothetical protein